MTHKLKTCLLIIFLIMIITWSTPLQASQDQHGEMTDGTYFIYNQVLGGGAILLGDDPANYTPVGTIGQVLSNIGVADAAGVTQHAGFWHALKGSDEKLLSFNRSEIHLINESNADTVTATLGLALNKPANPITVTIATSRNQSIGNAVDYTLYKNNIPQNTSTVSLVMNGQINEALTVEINNDRDIEEGDEIITFSITNIEGDSDVKKGAFPEYVIKIPANDAWALTGTVKYLGSQTGELITEARGNQIREQYSQKYSWDTTTTEKTFSTKVPPGTYTICAYIDSMGAYTNVENEWEVKGSYTWTVTVNEDGSADCNGVQQELGQFDFSFAMHDPDDRYTSQFIEYTGTYKDWIDNYSDIGGPDEDFDEDGYTNFQEYLNGTDPTSVDQAYVYNGYDPAYDEDASSVENKYQIITTNPIQPKARFGESFLVDINYTTSDDNPGTTGLGLAIHYNSTFMTFAGWSNVLTETLAGDYKNLTILVKDEDEPDTPDDEFEDTDKVITIAWYSDLNDRSWPGLEIPLPLRLCTLKFSVKSEANGITYGDTSVLRFTATSKDTRYTFYASPTTVEMDPFSFDVDGNGKANALTDGLLIMRYLFGLIIKNPDLQEDAIADDAIRQTSEEIWIYLNNGIEMLDIDGNGDADALTDGLLIMRYMFGLTEGDPLIENAIAPDAINDTDDKVIPFIKHYLPQKGSTIITPTTD